MLQKKEPVTTSGFQKGLFTKGNILVNEPGNSPNCMDIQWNFDESIQKRYGSTTRNSVKLSSTSTAAWVLDSQSSLSVGIGGYWKLEEISGSRQDQVGTNDFYSSGSVGYATGIRGQAASFNASSSQLLFVPTQTNLTTPNSFSVGGWFYITSTSAYEIPLVAKRSLNGKDQSTVLLMHMDNIPITDVFGKTITTSGTINTDGTVKKFGTASMSINSSSYIAIGDSADFDFGSGDFTMDCWVRLNKVDNNDTQIVFLHPTNGSNYFYLGWDSSGANSQWIVTTPGLGLTINANDSISADTWMHLAFERFGNTFTVYRDGQIKGTAVSSSAWPDYSSSLYLGQYQPSSSYQFYGFIDEVRITKGLARYGGVSFTPPTKAYGEVDYEYYLYVNTNNYVTFRVSSSGTVMNGTVESTSFGAINTATWYNIYGWHTNTTNIGVSVNLSATTATYTAGVRSGTSPVTVGGLTDSTINFLTGRADEVSYWKKVLTANERIDLYGGGSGNSFNSGQSGYTWGMYDFGATDLRWLMVAAGTGVYASSNMGVSFVVATTTRTENYQSFERSKNVLIMTSDAKDVPLYWAGSVGTYAQVLAPNSAPPCKYAINYQGYLILLNSNTRKRGFYYADDSLQLTSDWSDFFELPSSADDEIMAAFVVNRILYVSTRYRLYKLSITGGNPDWQYTQVKAWGFVPRTVGICFMQDREWAIGMDWNRRLRAFDGFNEMFISDNVEAEGTCDFAMEKISYSGSGLTYSNAVFDPIEQEYRLNVAIGLNSSQTTHAILLNTRSKALYPYSNQRFQAMCIAESDNKQFPMACDRSGWIHILNSGNTDIGTPINEIYESPFIFNKVPGMISKGGKLDLFFRPTSSGTIYYQDKADFLREYPNSRKELNIQETDEHGNAVSHLAKSIDVPSTHNILQYKLMSSASTTEPWVLTHTDFYQQAMGIGRGN